MGLIVLVIILLVASCAVLFGGAKGAQLGDSFGIKGKGDAGCTGCLAIGILLFFAVLAVSKLIFRI